MKIQVTSYVYESMKRIHPVYIPEIDGVYTVEKDGSIPEKHSHIEHDGEKWIWIPHEDSMFKIHPICVEFKIFED